MNRAMASRWDFIGGGPNCYTWSICRWSEEELPPRLGGLRLTHWKNRSIPIGTAFLLLRQMVITALAQRAVHSFLEHPKDPKDCSQAQVATQCSSIWTAEAYKKWHWP